MYLKGEIIIHLILHLALMVPVRLTELSFDELMPHRSRRQLLFPNSTLLQLNIGMGTPTPIKTINFNWALQLNFQLPWNRTQIPVDIFGANAGYVGTARKTRETAAADQKYTCDAKLFHFYKYVEDMLTSFGHNGTACVLRSLCQLGAEPLHATSSEDLLHEIATYVLKLYLLHSVLQDYVHSHKRQKRYLLFTPFTQYGVFVTVSIPLPHPENLVSVAWFIEANYYNVDNATYFEPLLGDIGDVPTVRHQRSTKNRKNNIITRRSVYTAIETMLERHGYSGRQCLLRAICESASQFLHNGVLGDLLHLVLTPSTSMSEEDIEDFYYEAEYWGLEEKCDDYVYTCTDNPIDYISIRLE